MNQWADAAAAARSAGSAFTMPDPETPLGDGYAMQDAYVAAVGAEVGGFKLAVNGRPQMDHFGVNEPVSARIFAGEIFDNGVALAKSRFSALHIEPELCAILGDDIPEGPVDRDGATAAIDRFHAAIELIDQRGNSVPELGLGQAVALNVFNAGIVLGKASVSPAELDLPNLSVVLKLDGKIAAQTTGTAPQDPIDAVAWLLTSLNARGVPVRPGMVVMCGTHHPLRLVEPATRSVAFEMTGLGEVGFTLTD